MVSLNIIHLGSFITPEFFYALLEQWLRNMTAQLAKTEQSEKHYRRIGSRQIMGEQQAEEDIKSNETLVYDPYHEDDCWYGERTIKAYEMNTELRRERERLLLAVRLIESVIANAKKSGDWQRALAQQTLQDQHRERLERNRQQLRILDPKRTDEPQEEPLRVPEYAYAVHIQELTHVMNALDALQVNPHKEA